MHNHYIPQFYLKRWTVNKKVVEFSRPNPHSREVKPHSKPTKGTGYEDGLYDFVGLPPDKRHQLEEVFFRMVDSRANYALTLIEENREVLTGELRQAWVMFLMSLIARHPDDITIFKEVYTRNFKRFSGAEQDLYKKARQASDPETAEEFFATVGATLVKNFAMKNIPEFIQHERSVIGLMNMHWSVAVPPEHGYFLTSDRPTIRTLLGHEKSHWILPIGPRRLFIAAENWEYGRAIRDAIAGQAWKEVNRQVVRRASRYGYADHQRHLPFFQKHLSVAPAPSMFGGFVPEPRKPPPLQRVP